MVLFPRPVPAFLVARATTAPPNFCSSQGSPCLVLLRFAAIRRALASSAVPCCALLRLGWLCRLQRVKVKDGARSHRCKAGAPTSTLHRLSHRRRCCLCRRTMFTSLRRTISCCARCQTWRRRACAERRR
eukprot:6192725-Pleurochrysis_carterae.AAC.1